MLSRLDQPRQSGGSVMSVPRNTDWLVIAGVKEPDRLHHVPAWKPEVDGREGRGTAACGIVTLWEIPGPFSRLGLARCPLCCDVVGVPHGQGAAALEQGDMPAAA